MRDVQLAVLTCVGWAVLQPSALSAETPPNVIVLLADDLGWTGLRCFGSDLYETPHLDQLAADGMRFNNAYAACTVCSPTRASIMTGMYPARLHLTDFIAGQNRPWAKMRIPQWTKSLDESYVTLPEALRQGGYTTVHVGKWHLSQPSKRSDALQPSRHGFDIEVLKPQQVKGYLLPEGFNQHGESGSDYLTDYLTDKALAIIDEVKDRPFFLYFAYHTPHTPIQGRADLVARFRELVKPDAVHQNPEYAAMVSSLDQSVGRIMDRLKHHGIDERTIVIFTSDNGGLTERNGKHDGFTENLPLRRGKGSAYEGGIRVPAIVRWPGTTRPGSMSDAPMMTIDYYPTILNMTGVPGDQKQNTLVDGQNLVPLLKDPAARLDRDLYWHYPHYHAGGDGPYSAIRSGDWRLVEFHEEGDMALYDLSADIGESHNLADAQPQRVAEMRGRLQAWRKAVDAQMPTANPDYDPRRATEVRGRKN